jgi:hypothetical protein
MLPPRYELELVATHRRQREAEARIERMRRTGRLRARTASLLRAVADRLAPAPSVPPAHAKPANHCP